MANKRNKDTAKALFTVSLFYWIHELDTFNMGLDADDIGLRINTSGKVLYAIPFKQNGVNRADRCHTIFVQGKIELFHAHNADFERLDGYRGQSGECSLTIQTAVMTNNGNVIRDTQAVRNGGV